MVRLDRPLCQEIEQSGANGMPSYSWDSDLESESEHELSISAVIRNGRTSLIMTSAPQVTRHCFRLLASSVLTFFWRRLGISWSFTAILTFHSASSSIDDASFSLGSSSSKWASFSRIERKIPELSLLHSKTAVRIMCEM